jgi:hypothetical protein
MSRRGEDILISSVLLLAALITLTLLILFGVEFAYLMIAAWGRWGW